MLLEGGGGLEGVVLVNLEGGELNQGGLGQINLKRIFNNLPLLIVIIIIIIILLIIIVILLLLIIIILLLVKILSLYHLMLPLLILLVIKKDYFHSFGNLKIKVILILL